MDDKGEWWEIEERWRMESMDYNGRERIGKEEGGRGMGLRNGDGDEEFRGKEERKYWDGGREFKRWKWGDGGWEIRNYLGLENGKEKIRGVKKKYNMG